MAEKKKPGLKNKMTETPEMDVNQTADEIVVAEKTENPGGTEQGPEVVNGGKKLTGIFDVIGWAVNWLFEKEKKRWLWVLKAHLGYFGIVIIVVLPVLLIAGIGGFLSGMNGFDQTSLVIIGGLGLAVLGLFLILIGFSAAYFSGLYVELYNDRKMPIRELARKSWRNSWRFFCLNGVVGLIVLGGFLLLIVPGVIWSITYAFATYVMYEQSGSIKGAMQESKRLTGGYKWELFKKWIGLSLVTVVISGVLTGMTKNADSILVEILSLAGSMVINTLIPLVYLKYYYELKTIKS